MELDLFTWKRGRALSHTPNEIVCSQGCVEVFNKITAADDNGMIDTKSGRIQILKKGADFTWSGEYTHLRLDIKRNGKGPFVVLAHNLT